MTTKKRSAIPFEPAPDDRCWPDLPSASCERTAGMFPMPGIADFDAAHECTMAADEWGLVTASGGGLINLAAVEQLKQG